jgi:gas vesicle structural protein
MPDPGVPMAEGERVALVELVNRVVDKGVVLHGELTISVADVDLVFLGLQVLLCSADRMMPPLTLEAGRPAAAPGEDVR